MKKLIIFILFYAFLYANPVVDIYRDGGLKAVEQYIQSQLIKKDYWDSKLKKRDVSYGYYENLDSLLIANKNKKQLKVYEHKNDDLKFVKSYNVIVGANGDKKKEGDLKTPLGVYDITKRFVPSGQFYGPLAYALSYPNTYDKVQGKNGYGIWIHGSPLDGTPRDPMSKGCIVLNNETITMLDGNIKPKSTITIVSEKGIKKVKRDEVSTILSELFKWKKAWKSNDVKTYLDFYHDDFRRYDGMKKRKFSRMKKSIFSRKQKKEIKFTNINVSPYPNDQNKNLFKIAFYEVYKSRGYKFRGNKELFVELNKKSFTILSEK